MLTGFSNSRFKQRYTEGCVPANNQSPTPVSRPGGTGEGGNRFTTWLTPTLPRSPPEQSGSHDHVSRHCIYVI